MSRLPYFVGLFASQAKAQLAFGCALCCVAFVGCKGLRKTSECDRFVTLANAALAEIQLLDAPNNDEPHPENYTKLAERFSTLKQQVTNLGLKDKELAEAAAGFQASLEHAEKNSRAYAEHLRLIAAAGDDEKSQTTSKRALAAARSDMQRVARTHENNKARVDSLCQPR